MHIFTLITVYVNDNDRPENPLIKTHLITTDGSLAEANYNSLVAKMTADNWEPVDHDSAQTSFTKCTEQGIRRSMVVHLNTMHDEFSMTVGKRSW